MKNEWPKIYNIVPDVYDSSTGQYTNNSDFKPEYLQDISQINYFLDFIDSSSDIKEFSVSNIGRRQQVINDNAVNCVFEPSVPDVVLIRQSGSNDESGGIPSTETSALRKECIERDQSYYQVPDTIDISLLDNYYINIQVTMKVFLLLVFLYIFYSLKLE